MTYVSCTELRKHLSAYMDEVFDGRAPLFVTRSAVFGQPRDGNRTVVMLSEAEYEAMVETLHLLNNPVHAVDLLVAISELESGKGIEHPLLEPL